ncbi:hypothetical protein ETAA8_33530 [Anatilimnocola aggregata]|uniref:Uncharacterized protein n=1 Tax=Anatilimnocola aggregata TaxID=2528021 RepID=A0A517YDE1_9BACT|nr:hypothetical protein [Anatilimnocola aggregata]QDU28253.1 hypothetical protein ETAA8_33530 [Anatilimnocola aggregata]
MNSLLMALCLCSAELGGGNCPNCVPGHGDVMGSPEEIGYRVVSKGDPCYRGTIFPALKLTRAYRDNQAFAYHHFEGKRLQISGRLVNVKRDLVPVAVRDADGRIVLDQFGNQQLEQKEAFVALVTPDGKLPLQFGLEFRFLVDDIKTKPEIRCALAALWAGQFVTLKGDCKGALTSPDGLYTAIIFEKSEIVP